MCSLFKFGQDFSVPKKGFFREDLATGNIHIWSGTIKVIFDGFILQFSGNKHSYLCQKSPKI